MVSSAGLSIPVIGLAEAITRNVIAAATWSSSGRGLPSGGKQEDSSVWRFSGGSVHGVNKGEGDEGGTQ